MKKLKTKTNKKKGNKGKERGGKIPTFEKELKCHANFFDKIIKFKL